MEQGLLLTLEYKRMTNETEKATETIEKYELLIK